MNRFAATFALGATLILGMATASRATAEEIRWLEDVGAAQRQAVQENKLLLLHFWSADSAECQNLETTVFIDEQVVATVNRHFVPVKVDAAARPDVCEQFQVKTWPTDLFLTATGTQVYRGKSPPKLHTYRTTLELIASPGSAPDASGVASEAAVGASDPMDPYAPRTSLRKDPYASADRPVDAPLPTGNDYAESRSTGPAAAQEWAPSNVGSRNDPYAALPPEASLSQPPVDPATFGKPPVTGGVPNFDDVASESEVAANPYRQVAYGGPGSAPTANDATSPTFDAPPAQATPSVSATSASYSRPATSKNLRLALDGYCPVTLFAQSAWIKGDPRWGAKHRGVVYLFADAQARDTFLADPDSYSLAWQGVDAVEFVERGRTVSGIRDFGVIDDDGFVPGIVIFTNEQNLAKFEANKQFYSQKMDELLRTRSNVAAGAATYQR